MNWISGAKLVAAVSNAGGLGTLGPNAGAKKVTTDYDVTGERLREQIRMVKNLTEKPFAVNIPIGFGEGRRYSEKCLQVVLEEGVSIVVTSVGSPKVYTQKLKDHGIVVMHAVSTMSQAKKSEASFVDAVICEGYEGGGHKGFEEMTSFTLIPMVADNVKIPVIAGGGIVDARGILAALALGADGVYMGTRLMASLESDAHPKIKDAIVKSEDVCTVSLDHGEMLGRCLKNSYTQKYKDMAESGASSEELSEFHRDHSLYHTQMTGDIDGCEIMCGQGAGLIKSILSVDEIIGEFAKSIPFTLEKCKEKLSDF
jgi:enoyl-[acyl-carrier protein] reductase II